MRDILFRGKNVTNGQWVYGCLVNNLWTYSELADFPQGTPVCEIITGKYEGDSWDDIIGSDENAIITVDPKTVGQYTGLKDKNGKEIYEGDKVVVLSGESAIVVFRNGSFMLEWIGFDSYADLLGWIDFKKCVEYEGVSFEIIGNIHEPKLTLNS